VFNDAGTREATREFLAFRWNGRRGGSSTRWQTALRLCRLIYYLRFSDHLPSVRAGLAFLGEADPPLMHSFTIASRRSRSSGSVLIWIVSSTKRKLICLPVSLMRCDRRCIGIVFTCARSQQRP
jgi:hypothetical protein